MRNNASQPSIGHVIMFAAVTVGWMILFLITLTARAPGTTFWIKVVFSGGLMIASGAGTLLLWRRVARQRKAADKT